MKYYRLDNGKKSRGMKRLSYFGKCIKPNQSYLEEQVVFDYSQLKNDHQLYAVINEEPYPIRDVLASHMFLVVTDKVYQALPLEKFDNMTFQPVKLAEYINDDTVAELNEDSIYYALLSKVDRIKVMDDQKSDFVSLGDRQTATRMIKNWVIDEALNLDKWVYSTLYSGYIVSEDFFKFLDDQNFKGLGVK